MRNDHWRSLRRLLPPFVLVATVTVLIGIPLWTERFAYAPLGMMTRTLRATSPLLMAVIAVRLLLWLVPRFRLTPSQREPIDPRAVRTSAVSVAACFLILAALAAPYCWGKILIPYFRERVFDAELYRIDVALHLGIDPVLFVQALLDHRALDFVIGRGYELFDVLLVSTSHWFMTSPDLDRRHRFVRGLVLLWMGGLALYWLIPAMGPCYVSDSLLPVLRERFPHNHATQVALISNYENVGAVLGGALRPIELSYGIAAMPSLHVALPAYTYFHCRRFGHPARAFFLAVTVLFLVGSVATAWHYAIDGYVGILLAWLCQLAVSPPRRNRGEQRTAPAMESPEHALSAPKPRAP